MCCNMAAVCFCWCEAHIYSGHAQQGEQPQCSRAAWQVVQNVLTVHSRWLDLTKTDKRTIAPGSIPSPPPRMFILPKSPQRLSAL